jgi:diguanylate cyclase (GGDEF)-like protein
LPNVVEAERSAIIVPMIVENDVIGAFYVGAAQQHFYDEEALKLVSTVAYQTAMGIKNAELYERTVALAITDGVTGLYTHRYFQERLGEACREYERSLKPFSLVMIDTDHFKAYNDTLGHPEGDKVLREIAALIKSYTRDSDLVCRYGGDEFAVILKDTDKENSVKTSERIREAFQYRFHTYPVKITSSIGVANFPEDATNKIDLLSAADTTLYKSKKGGRNRVSVATSLKEQGKQMGAQPASAVTKTKSSILINKAGPH